MTITPIPLIPFNPSNAEAAFVQSTRAQIFEIWGLALQSDGNSTGGKDCSCMVALLAGPSGHAYLGSCFEMSIVRTAMLEMLRPD